VADEVEGPAVALAFGLASATQAPNQKANGGCTVVQPPQISKIK
jgi:hypothetical protein